MSPQTDPRPTTPSTVLEDAPVTTPTTTQTPNTPPARTPVPACGRTWFYWVAYSFNGGGGAVEVSYSVPITRGDHVRDIAKIIGSAGPVRELVVTSWTLLRVEDGAGQVIG